MRFNDFTWKDIIFEAPENETGDEGELSATDYDDASNVDIEESDPDTDSGSTDDPADEDPLADDDSDDVDPADEDPLADDEEGSDENPEDEQTDKMENDISSDKQNKNLVNDFIELYIRIDTIMQQLRTDCKTNIRYNSNMLVVRKNLEKLKEVTYDYIVNKFTKESYVANLYQFNLIIQALNTNIDLLSSVLASNRKFEGEQKSKKKKLNKKK